MRRKQGKPQTIKNPLNPILTKALTKMPLDDLKSLKNLPKKTPEQPPGHTKALTTNKGIPIEDIISYRAKGLTMEEIGALTGCTKQTVSERLKALNLDGLQRFDQGKDIILTHHQRRVVNALTDEDIQKMSGLQKLIGIKLTDEAIRTIRGQATEIIDHRVMVLDLSKAIKAMRVEQASVTEGEVEGIHDIVTCPPVDN